MTAIGKQAASTVAPNATPGNEQGGLGSSAIAQVALADIG